MLRVNLFLCVLDRVDNPQFVLSLCKTTLKRTVARELSINHPGEKLVGDNVEVYFVDPPDDGARNCGFGITIEANDLPDRRSNKEERADRILKTFVGTVSTDKTLGPLFSGLTGYVWLRLLPAAFTQAQVPEYPPKVEPPEEPKEPVPPLP